MMDLETSLIAGQDDSAGDQSRCPFAGDPVPPMPRVKVGTKSSSNLQLARRLRTDLTVLFENPNLYREDYIVRKSLFTTIISVMDPAFVRHVLATNAQNYHRGTLQKNLVRVWSGDSVITSEGAKWKKARGLVEPWFQRKSLGYYTIPIASATQVSIDEMKKAPVDVPVSIEAICARLSTTVIVHSLFSSSIDSQLDVVHRELTRIQELMTKVSFGDIMGLYRFFKKRYSWETYDTLEKLKEVFTPIIEHRRNSGERKPDFLQALLDAGKEDVEHEPLTDDQVYDNVFSMFLGAPESTGYALTWALYLMSIHPEVQEKAYAEICEVLGERNPTPEDLPNLKYLWAVVCESLRLYPPVHSFVREAVDDDEFKGVKIPKGSTVFFPVYAIHRHEKLWDEPNAFNPDRFLDESTHNVNRIFSFLAFSSGPRFCAGRPLAEMELKVILSMLVRSFQFHPSNSDDVGLRGLVSLRPAKPIKLMVRARSGRT
jgi:cytochrome P450